MTREKLVVIKEADITNNCPECYNQDLKISFYQKHIYGRFFNRATSEVSHKIKCNKCDSLIYPVNWTEDIERTFEYYTKMVLPKKTSIKFNPLFFIVLASLIISVVVSIYMFKIGVIQF
jgi:hypothetical protein